MWRFAHDTTVHSPQRAQRGGEGGDDAAGGCEGVEDSCWEVERKREVVLYVEEK